MNFQIMHNEENNEYLRVILYAANKLKQNNKLKLYNLGFI